VWLRHRAVEYGFESFVSVLTTVLGVRSLLPERVEGSGSQGFFRFFERVRWTLRVLCSLQFVPRLTFIVLWKVPLIGIRLLYVNLAGGEGGLADFGGGVAKQGRFG